MSASVLFPAFLDLRRRRCVVVGAGEIARQKIAGLLASGARVRVLAPEACAEVQELAKRDALTGVSTEGSLEWKQRRFLTSDLDGAFLVVAATGDPQVNEEVYREAEARGVLCNAVDDPKHCHFQYPAVVRRGDLQIAISTAGNSPALAQRLRAELEEQFGPEYGAWLRWLGAVRQLLFRREVPPEERKPALHRIARGEVYERFVATRQRRHGESRR